MKVFQLLMQNTEEDEYLYRGTLGSTSPCSWKPKMQPTHSPPFFCQPKQPLNQFSAKNPNTPVSSYAIRPARASERSKEAAHIHSALKKIILKRPKSPIHAWVCVSNREPMWSVEIHSLPFILRQKVPGRMKGKLECLLKPLKGPLAEPQIASLLSTTQP